MKAEVSLAGLGPLTIERLSFPNEAGDDLFDRIAAVHAADRMSPRRIQRSRAKGWRMPPDTVYVGRPTRWGNPWRVGEIIGGEVLTAERAVRIYRGLYREHADKLPNPQDLRGKNLACWCPLDQPCHADVLLGLANGG